MPKVAAVLLELRDLCFGDFIEDRQRTIVRRNAVVRGAERKIGPPHFQSALAQTRKSLRRSHFVDQMKVDIEQRRGPGCSATTWLSQTFSNDGAWLLHCRCLYMKRLAHA